MKLKSCFYNYFSLISLQFLIASKTASFTTWASTSSSPSLTWYIIKCAYMYKQVDICMSFYIEKKKKKDICMSFECVSFVCWERERERERERKHVLIWHQGLSSIFFLTFAPMASKWKLSEQETLAWSTSRPSSSKASNTKTSKPQQLLLLKTSIRKPFSWASTLTCGYIDEIQIIN